MKQAVIRRLSHTLVRYFLSYFLIASILLLGFSLVSYKMLSDVITERMHTQTVERMEYAVERIQSRAEIAVPGSRRDSRQQHNSAFAL